MLGKNIETTITGYMGRYFGSLESMASRSLGLRTKGFQVRGKSGISMSEGLRPLNP